MLEKHKISKSKLKRLDKKRKLYQERYGLNYDEFIQKQKEKQEKKKYSFKGIKSALQFCKSDVKNFWGLIILILIETGIGVVGAYMYAYIINNVTLALYEKALYTLLIRTGCLLLNQLLFYFDRRLFFTTYANITYNIKKKLFSNVLQVNTAKYNDVASGEIINRVTNDTSSFANSITSLIDEIGCFIESLSYVIVSFVMNFYLGLVMTVFGCIAYLVRKIYAHKKASLYSSRTSQIGDANTTIIQESIRGNRDIKNLNLKNVLDDKQSNLSKNYRNSALDNQLLKSINHRWSVSIIILSETLILLLAIFLIKNNYTTLGMTIGILSFLWSGMGMFNLLGDIITNIKETSVHAERMLEIFDDEKYPKEKFGNINLENFKGEVEFKKVSFSYKKDNALFKNLSFKINAGESIGIVGKSGQGKSTIISLINKLFEVDKGKICIDGVDIKELTEDCLRNNISVVSQSPYIFDLTVKENLELVNKNATMDDIINACKQAYIHDFIMTLEKGYDSKIGEGGVQLSGGQKQRLAIARALLRNTKILLLDEATSALDNESQEKIKRAINKIKKDKTVIIVAHRLTTVIDCDRILFIDENKIKADGKHKDLMKTCHEYKQLYNTEDDTETNEE